MSRLCEVNRTTKETDIKGSVNLDGSGKTEIDSGIGFFDHMLVLMAVHARMDISLSSKGDLKVDGHHTVEDVGIVLGKAISGALADRAGICRYGEAHVPMDETLVRVCMDLSNRPYAFINLPIQNERLGELDSELVTEFFRAIAQHAGITLHIDLVRGSNSHHIAEAAFKAFGRALHAAAKVNSEQEGVLSSKGTL